MDIVIKIIIIILLIGGAVEGILGGFYSWTGLGDSAAGIVGLLLGSICVYGVYFTWNF